MRDLKSNIKPVQSLIPLNRNAASNGAGVDTLGFNSASMVVAGGAIGGTASPTFTFELQESADNTTFNAVAAADMRGTNPVITAGSVVSQVGYIGNKRYLRAILKTVSGTTPTLDCSANIILGHPTVAPTV